VTVCRDALKLASPQAQAELALLKGLEVGAVREGVLLPALEVGVQWVLTLKTADRWEFDGTFFGQPLYRLVIRIDGAMLTLNVLEAA
jgi:hypothetical protein